VWETVSNIAAVVVIVILFELLGLPDWIRGRFKGKQGDGALRTRLDDIESRVRDLERKVQ
jgi:hypothetical protein